MKCMKQILSAGCAALLIGGSARAVVIYSDDFSGSAGTDLHGTMPDVNTTGQSWVARNTYKADGSFSWEGFATATLAFTPVDGRVYTADAKIENLTGNHWLQFGFGNGQPSIATDPVWSTRAWHLLRVTEQAASHGTFINGFSSGADWTDLGWLRYDEPLDVRIVLDTTGGTGNWTATWYGKADSDAAYTEVRGATVLTAEDIDSVGFSVYNTTKTGRLLSFSLSDDAGGGLLGDFDGDGDIDGVDVAEMFSNFNGPGGGVPGNPATDLDNDGDADGVDVATLFGLFTGPLAPAIVPEPTGLALFSLGGLLIARSRRR